MSELFSDYELSFISLNEIESNIFSTRTNVIFINSIKTTESINFGKLSENFIVFSNFSPLFSQDTTMAPEFFIFSWQKANGDEYKIPVKNHLDIIDISNLCFLMK